LISMEPVLRRGLTEWDRALFPPDEFSERLAAVQGAMRRASLAALAMFSDAYHPSADLAYVAGWPMGGALLVTLEGEPAMLTSDNGRGVYFQRWLTWIEDTSAAGGRIGPALADALRRRGVKGALGVTGDGLLSAQAYEKARQALSDFELRPFEAELAALRRRKRPRELIAIRTALRIARGSVAAGQLAFEVGASNAAALAAAERSARLGRARDFRGLANLEGADLRPYEAASATRRPFLALWCAVDFHGYWAEAASAPNSPDAHAEAALEAMLRVARPGASGDDLARAALAVLPSEAAQRALSYGLGAGIGLSAQETPIVRPGGMDLLEPGAVLCLRVVGGEQDKPSLASALIAIGEDGAKRIEPL